MRRLIAALALVLAGCAQPGFPPGGPEEKVPPKLLAIEPESGAVNVRLDEVNLQFDEVLNEQPSGGGSELSDLVIISPRLGEPRVGWHRKRLTIRGQRDWKPNTAYTVTLLPGVGDLRGNVRQEPTITVFSTGAVIPDGDVGGIAFDWLAGGPLAQAVVEAISVSDTTTVYVARADSAGRFSIAHMPAGAYTVRTFGDANNDRLLDPREIWDTVGVVLRDTARVELLAFIHDTIGPRIQQARAVDSVTLRVRFDKPLDPALRIDTSLFTLRRADSTIVPIRLAESGPAWDSTHAGEARGADSAQEADSTRAADSARAAARPAPARRTARTDTTKRAPAPKPSRPSPSSDVVLVVAAPLAPGSAYRLEWRGAKNLLGYSASGSFSFNIPKAGEAPVPGAPPGAREPPPDTSRRGAEPSRPTPPPIPPDTSRTADITPLPSRPVASPTTSRSQPSS